MEKTKSKSAKKSKKHKSKIKGEKKESQKGKKLEKNGLVHLHLFCFFDLLFAFAFYFAFRCFFSRQKAPKKKSKSKKQNKCKKKCEWTSPFFSPCLSLFDVPFFPIDFASGFFSFEVLLFDFSMCFSFFLHFFSSLKIIRISYGGEHNSWAQVHSWSLGIRPYLQNSIHIGRTDTNVLNGNRSLACKAKSHIFWSTPVMWDLQMSLGWCGLAYKRPGELTVYFKNVNDGKSTKSTKISGIQGAVHPERFKISYRILTQIIEAGPQVRCDSHALNMTWTHYCRKNCTVYIYLKGFLFASKALVH